MPNVTDIRTARERIAPKIVATPCAPALGLTEFTPCRCYFKLENLQRTGSFKDRGSLNRLLQLTPEERKRGVVTASAGNHAQALAYHGCNLDIDVTVVMPEHTPLIKVANTKRFGARIVQTGATLSDAMGEAERLVREEGRVLVHAFDDEFVIAGQGTIGLEILEQVPDVSLAIVPIGGGGLISGIALALKEKNPGIRIIGVEAENAASAYASRQSGRVVKIETRETIADGIATKGIGQLTFPIIEKYVDDIVTVDEQEIAASVHLMLERQKVVAEGAGAVPLAALLARRVPVLREDNAVLVLSGGNIDVTMIERIIARGLVNDGRLARLIVTVPDRPGSLAKMTRIVAAAGANVEEVSHHRAFADISVGEVTIAMQLETRGREHVEEIVRLLEGEGLRVEEVA